MDWKELFDKCILERGFDYYIEGAVDNIDISEDIICAEVEGTEPYQVEINMEKGEITDMYCSCHYAEDGQNCKHMAAVLYEYENRWNTDKDDKDTSETAATLVSGADEGVVRAFLAEILEKDARLYIKFKNMVSPQISVADIKSLKNQIDGMLFSYADKYGTIDYNSAWDFCNELAEFTDDNVQILIDRGYLEEAFDLIVYIYNVFSRTDIDDSDGGLCMVSNSCCDKLEKIISKAGVEMKTKLYGYIKECIDKEFMYFFVDDIEELLFNKFNEDEFVNANLELTDKKLIAAEEITDCWNKHYKANRWFKRHIELMDKHGTGLDEKLEYCKAHWYLSEARKFCIETYYSRKDYDKTIEILKESIELDKDFYGTVSEYRCRLKDVYKEAGYTEKYIELLWELVIGKKNFELYKELKELYSSEEWLEKREILFDGVSGSSFVAELYNEENLYDRLLDFVLNSEGLYETNTYANVLSKLYPDEILRKYRIEIEKIAVNTADRKRYRDWVGILRRMKKIKGGDALVDEIVRGWKKVYARRKAMMDELSRL